MAQDEQPAISHIEHVDDQGIVDSDSKAHHEAIKSICAFLRSKTTYDILPVSFRLIVLDSSLLIKKALAALLANEVVSAPLWDSKHCKFAGMLTVSDFINLIQYYYRHSSYAQAQRDIERFELGSLRDVEKIIGVPPPQLVAITPEMSTLDACKQLVNAPARRLPLIDHDSETVLETLVSVLTQYRVLKFIAMNCRETTNLTIPIRSLGLGTYENVATATLDTSVFDVISLMATRCISSVPIIDIRDGIVINLYEAVDVLTLVKLGVYNDLQLTVGEALNRTRPDDFPGVRTCHETDSLAAIFDLIRSHRVHRLVIVDADQKLRGMIGLSDIMHYLINYED